MRKLLFFDIDGTLCMPGEAPSPRTVHAIRSARARGHKVFLSTGRNLSSIPKAVDAIGFDGYIYNAGACAQVGTEILLDQPLSPELLEQTLSILRAHDGCFILQCTDGNYFDFDLLEEVWRDTPALTSGYFDQFRTMLALQDYKDYPGSPVYKVCFFTPGEAEYRALKPLLEPWYTFTLFDNLLLNLPAVSGEANQRSADKGRALEIICAHLGQSTEDAIAFGDSTNDSAMLLAAGLGIAMENGQPEVKALADRICPDCREDGVARTLEALGLT